MIYHYELNTRNIFKKLLPLIGKRIILLDITGNYQFLWKDIPFGIPVHVVALNIREASRVYQIGLAKVNSDERRNIRSFRGCYTHICEKLPRQVESQSWLDFILHHIADAKINITFDADNSLVDYDISKFEHRILQVPMKKHVSENSWL